MDTLRITAPQDQAGERTDRFLAGQAEGLSRSRVKALIKEGAVTCDGSAITDPNAPVIAGALYVLAVPTPRPATPEPEDIPIDILHEDTDLIVINKPVGMAVHPAPGSWDGTLVNALLHHCQGNLPGIGGVERPGIVHRIDKLTSGILVVAKTEAAHAGLSALFADHDIQRTYLAITRGAPRPLSGTIKAPIARSTSDRKKMSVPRSPDAGRHAVTHYKALETFGLLDKASGWPAAALLECRLETGRTHQIRVHLSHIGAPLIGDPVYGRHRGIKAFGSGDAFIAATSVARAFNRQALHAASLGFVHPVSGDRLEFQAPLPADMDSVLTTLRALD